MICRIPRKWVLKVQVPLPKLCGNIADQLLFHVLLSDVLSVGLWQKLMENGKFSDNLTAKKMDSYLMLAECLSIQIIGFRTSAIELIHSERVSAMAAPFVAKRLAYSLHVEFLCHKYESGSHISGFCSRDLSVLCHARYLLKHLSLHGDMERTETLKKSNYKVGILRKTSEVSLLQTWYVVKEFRSNGMVITIRYALRLLLLIFLFKTNYTVVQNVA